MIDQKKILVWTGGVGGGKAVNLVSEYAETSFPELEAYYFKELVSLLGGPAAVAIAWKLSKDPRRNPAYADVIGLAGIELFIDRLAKLGAEFAGIAAPPVNRPVRRRSGPGAPPPGGTAPGHWPYTSQQRLPFQSDITW